MSSFIESIITSTAGLLLNSARDSIAAKLQDGDVTDAKFRKSIVRELNDIKTKLDGLSRKDLHTSYSFWQQGVDFLLATGKSRVSDFQCVSRAQHKTLGYFII